MKQILGKRKKNISKFNYQTFSLRKFIWMIEIKIIDIMSPSLKLNGRDEFVATRRMVRHAFIAIELKVLLYQL